MNSSIGGVHVCLGYDDGYTWVAVSHVADAMEESSQGMAILAVGDFVLNDSEIAALP